MNFIIWNSLVLINISDPENLIQSQCPSLMVASNQGHHLYSLAHKSEKVYNLRDFWMRDYDVRTYFKSPHSFAKIFHFSGAGHRRILELWEASLLSQDPWNIIHFV